jgi:hypothetical protein
MLSLKSEREAFEGALVARLLAGGTLDSTAAERALRLRADNKDTIALILNTLGLVTK